MNTFAIKQLSLHINSYYVHQLSKLSVFIVFFLLLYPSLITRLRHATATMVVLVSMLEDRTPTGQHVKEVMFFGASRF